VSILIAGDPVNHPVADLAGRLRDGRDTIVLRWLERITARIGLDRDIVFPSETLIDDIPLIVEGIARHLESDTDDVSTLSEVVAKARELGRLRFEQAVSARQILWEYEMLGSLILRYVEETVDGAPLPVSFIRRFHTALSVVQRHTAEEYHLLAEQQSAARESRLRSFNQALSHEVRSSVGAVLGAARMLEEPFVLEDTEQRSAFLRMIVDNAESMERVLTNLLQIAVVESDVRRNRHVLLEHAVEEVLRRLRGFAASHEVVLGTEGELPRLEVTAPVVDLVLTNLIANAVKYHHPARPQRWVRVSATVAEGSDLITVEVTDNGTGVPEEERPLLFERFFRSSAHAGIDGTGLGLSLVRDALERFGGRAWADFPETGETIFAFTLPARRVCDATSG
jgi:signal transduction histidine kinase